MRKYRWPRKILGWCSTERRRTGRPALEWESYIKREMFNRDLRAGDWEDESCGKGKRQIPKGKKSHCMVHIRGLLSYSSGGIL